MQHNVNLQKHSQKKQLLKTSIFFNTCSLLKETGFSSRINYLLFKRRFFYLQVLTSNTSAINKKLKLSRFGIKKGNNLGSLTGFYRAI